MNDSATNRHGQRLRTIVDIQFSVNVAQMGANSFFADPELNGNFLVLHAARNQLQDLLLTDGQGWVTRLEHLGHSSGMDLADDSHDFVGIDVFQEIGSGTRRERPEHVLIAGVHAQHHEVRVRKLSPDSLDRLDAVDRA